MVNRAEFEKELMRFLVPAITNAQDVIKAKFDVTFAIQVDWHLGKGYYFEDEESTHGGIGG